MAKHKKQKAKVVDALSMHIERVLMDRASFRRSMAAAEHYAKTGTGEQIGFIQVDAMDHAKFAIPRWTAQSKEWESRWRPALQCIGGTVWGVCEYWFLFDCDVRKDANMQCTVFSLMIDDATKKLKSKQIELPVHLAINTDNTAAETKTHSMHGIQCDDRVQAHRGHAGPCSRPDRPHAQRRGSTLQRCKSRLAEARDIGNAAGVP